MNGFTSNWKSNNAEVPQGSILGPYLILLFVNEIEDVVSNNIKLFADDTSYYMYYCIADSQETTGESLNADLENICQWAFNWKFSLMFKKEVSLIF